MAEVARLVSDVVWRMPHGALDLTEPGEAQQDPTFTTKKRINRRTGAYQVNFVASGLKVTPPYYSSLLLVRTWGVVSGVATALCEYPEEVAGGAFPSSSVDPLRLAALQRLVCSLQASRLLPALCAATLAAPALPLFEESGRPTGLAINMCGALVPLLKALETLAGAAANFPCLPAPLSAAIVELLAEPGVQRLLAAAAERVAELETDGGASTAAAAAVMATAAEAVATGCSGGGGGGTVPDMPVAALAGGWPPFEEPVAEAVMGRMMDRRTATRRWEAVHTTTLVWLVAVKIRGRTAAAAAVLPPPRTLVRLALRLGRALALAQPPCIDMVGETRAAAAVEWCYEVCIIATGLCISAALALEYRASAAEARELLPAALEAWAWCHRAIGDRMREATAASPGGLPGPCEYSFGYFLAKGDSWFRLQDTSAGWSALSGAQQRDAAERLADAGFLPTLDSLLRLAGSAGKQLLVTSNAVQRVLGPLFAPVASTALGLPPAAAAVEPQAPPLPAGGRKVGRKLGVLVTAAKLLLRETAQVGLVRPPDGPAGQTTAPDVAILQPLRKVLLGAGLGVNEAGLPVLLPACAAAAAAAAAGRDGQQEAGSGGAAPPTAAVLELMALCLRTAVLCGARMGLCLGDRFLLVCDDEGCDDEKYRATGFDAMRTAAECTAALRAAARLLPAEALLASRPLTLLGATALTLRNLHEGLQRGRDRAAGSRPQQLVDEVSSALAPLAQRLIATAARLGVHPAMEPTVRRWMMLPAKVSRAPPGSGLDGDSWYHWAPGH
ncbi:hypothetical protein GPECTOR_21g755 [Gonium pectorale]|uniref:Uncharacterized protein n=1 Tax=Gonium pectorale TaxID=33097 RepID=A0A150GI84_GONPE|nr:hypothetical protein GPECTOR_21g755 [Gonium pectorale]|eukprot:KXZ49527.1 hypothetical protein GPECTOR_21g755 [Gonium pectorale]